MGQRDRALAKLQKVRELREELLSATWPQSLDKDDVVEYIVRRLNDALDDVER